MTRFFAVPNDDDSYTKATSHVLKSDAFVRVMMSAYPELKPPSIIHLFFGFTSLCSMIFLDRR